jgi:hypothetical protein
MTMKRIFNALRPWITEALNGSFVIFGLAIAWALCPDGDTRDTIGTTLAILTVVWIATMPIRVGGE